MFLLYNPNNNKGVNENPLDELGDLNVKIIIEKLLNLFGIRRRTTGWVDRKNQEMSVQLF